MYFKIKSFNTDMAKNNTIQKVTNYLHICQFKVVTENTILIINLTPAKYLW